MPRPVVPQVECGHCGTSARCPTVILEQPVCQTCRLRFLRNPGPCPGCGVVKVLAWYDPHRRPACATCTGNPPPYACRRCGREDSSWGLLCAPCTLSDRLTDLMSTPDGTGIHPRLQPVFDTLLTSPRPQSTLFWMTRRQVGPGILRAMATGELPISHEAFTHLPVTRATSYLRDLLVACGVLEPFNAELARVAPWLTLYLADLPTQVADPLRRYTTWQVLRRLRATDRAGRLTHGAIIGARAEIINATRFLTWLHQRGLRIDQLTQPLLERYATGHPARAKALRSFIRWNTATGIIGHVDPPPTGTRPEPAVTVGDEQRWADVNTLLHDDTIRLYARVAGLFILLYAQPLAWIVAMRPHQITTASSVSVTFDTVPIELPTPLDQLVLEQLRRRGHGSHHAHPDRWLFPGRNPGRPLNAENIRHHLADRGIHPGTGRNAAMFHLASTIPVPVLADLLGISTNAASRWAALSGRSWNGYIAARRDVPEEANPILNQ